MGPCHSWETEAGEIEAACPRPRYELARDWDSHLCGSHLSPDGYPELPGLLGVPALLPRNLDPVAHVTMKARLRLTSAPCTRRLS